jgi:hypothetical protein
MRNRNNSPLSNEQIQRLAPSAFAGQPYEKQSDRYAFIPTSSVIDAMRDNGYLPTEASQSRTRIAGKQFFTKHLLRFRQQSTELANVGDSAMELVLVNSHDGSSAYRLMLGVFRLVCSNGLIVSESLAESIRVRHTGNIVNDVLEGSVKLIESAPIVQQTMESWRRIELSTPETQIFAEQALAIRYDGEQAPVTVEQVLQARRFEDKTNNLWTVFNRVQENTLRGGQRYLTAGTVRRNRTREVKGIDQNTNLNRALWTLAEKMAELKSK